MHKSNKKTLKILKNVAPQQPSPPQNPPHPPLDHVDATQENLINHLTQNSAQISLLVNRLRTSSLEHHSTLARTLETMANSANEVSREVTKWGSWRDRCRTFYTDGLLYDQVKKKGIVKADICAIFTNPVTSNNLELNTTWFPMHWCVHARLKDAFWDRWYMVFDQPPCNNWEVPLYFLRKLYCEFILGEKPNYFNIQQFQGRGRLCVG